MDDGIFSFLTFLCEEGKDFESDMCWQDNEMTFDECYAKKHIRHFMIEWKIQTSGIFLNLEIK